MHDPILEEIWRVREELVKKHGGFDGYFKYVQKLDRGQRRRKGRRRNGRAQPECEKNALSFRLPRTGTPKHHTHRSLGGRHELELTQHSS